MRKTMGVIGRALLLLVAIPIMVLAIPVILILNLLGLNKLNAGPDYVAKHLEQFIADTDGVWDWDDFCSVPLKDAELDSIRERICDLGPWNGFSDSRDSDLRELLDEVRAIQNATPAT